MRIILTKTTDDEHGLEVIRDDGSASKIALPTRSFLVHDLSHYVVEGSAGLSDGFWGAVAAGKSWDDLNDRTGQGVAEYGPAMSAIEGVVGPLSNALRGRTDGAAVLAGLELKFAADGQPVPAWVTPQLIAEATERLRRIMGEWKKVPYRGAMELRWPPEPLA